MGGKPVLHFAIYRLRALGLGFLGVGRGFAMILGCLLKRGYYKSMENTEDKV